jgi:hypothetical protein
MQKALLISIVVATLVLPMWAARERGARRGLKKALASMLVFMLLYLVGIMFVFPRL